jgi:hypothetical protein
VAGPPTGFHSGKMIRLVPNTLNKGFIEDVSLAPLVRVNLLNRKVRVRVRVVVKVRVRAAKGILKQEGSG